MNSVFIKTLKLENFRNIKHAQVEFSDGINIITGENGQGKTNLLESIWLITGAKSFKGAKDKDLINIGNDVAKVFSVIQDEENSTSLEIIISNLDGKKGRYAKVNNGEMKRAVSLAGKFYCVVFCPQHLALVSGAPALRRKFIDGALCQLYPSYIKTYKTFEKYLEQKNSLLKSYSRYPTVQAQELLNIYNKNIALYSYEIYLKRKQYIDMLADKAEHYYSNISANREKISFEYIYFADSQEGIYRLLQQNIDNDIRAGFSTVGVQREDVDIKINDISAKDFASQGQQRSIVLSMKLSESDILKDITRAEPVILLDDVLSELDYSRQEYLLHHIVGKQVFISSCDEERISLAKSKKFYLKNGEITQCM